MALKMPVLLSCVRCEQRFAPLSITCLSPTRSWSSWCCGKWVLGILRRKFSHRWLWIRLFKKKFFLYLYVHVLPVHYLCRCLILSCCRWQLKASRPSTSLRIISSPCSAALLIQNVWWGFRLMKLSTHVSMIKGANNFFMSSSSAKMILSIVFLWFWIMIWLTRIWDNVRKIFLYLFEYTRHQFQYLKWTSFFKITHTKVFANKACYPVVFNALLKLEFGLKSE